MMEIGKAFGKAKKDIASAITVALKSQEEFERMRLKRGQEYWMALGRMIRQLW